MAAGGVVSWVAGGKVRRLRRTTATPSKRTDAHSPLMVLSQVSPCRPVPQDHGWLSLAGITYQTAQRPVPPIALVNGWRNYGGGW